LSWIAKKALSFALTAGLLHEGPQFRKLEGKADRNHHGDVAIPLLSIVYNMGTNVSGVRPKFGPGLVGRGAQSTNNLESVVRNAHAAIERNIERTDRRTRAAYKDHQKIDGFTKLKTAGDKTKKSLRELSLMTRARKGSGDLGSGGMRLVDAGSYAQHCSEPGH